jgi:hypothetical protein
MSTRTKRCEASITLASSMMDESGPLSKRVLGHQVSAPERPTSTRLFPAAALSSARGS